MPNKFVEDRKFTHEPYDIVDKGVEQFRDTTLAYAYRSGSLNPGFFWLSGYRADMEGTKACFVDRLAQRLRRSCLRFDYSGHGASSGLLEEGNLSLWLEQSLFFYEKFFKEPAIIFGSSMGGWLALRLFQELKKRGKQPAALVLIAPAADFTRYLLEDQLSCEEEEQLNSIGYFVKTTAHGDAGTPFFKNFVEDARKHFVLDGNLAVDCPVYLLQGMQDDKVPYKHALLLLEHLPYQNVTLSLVHDGDHNLSRPKDLALLEKTILLALESDLPSIE